MHRTPHLVVLISGLFDSVAANQDCGFCYELNMRVIIGIIICDIILTLLFAVSVYCFASQQKKKKSLHSHTSSCQTGKGKCHQSSSKQKEKEVTESPYQELYGVQSDIYNDLRHYRK